jgi:RNA polymerase sigma-70 factor (ECF subfamily)
MQRADAPDVVELDSGAARGATARSDSFQRLADEHLDASYGLAFAILGNAADAQDATHDAFVTAWRKWNTLRDLAAFEAWFARILVNTCRNRIRRAFRTRPLDLSDELRLTAGDPYRDSDDRALIGAALAGLSAEHRIVVALRFYRDLTVDEIARWLSLPAGTVKSRLHYALMHMGRAIDTASSEDPR